MVIVLLELNFCQLNGGVSSLRFTIRLQEGPFDHGYLLPEEHPGSLNRLSHPQ